MASFMSLLNDSDDNIVYTNLTPASTLQNTASLIQSSSSILLNNGHVNDSQSCASNSSNGQQLPYSRNSPSHVSSVNNNDFNVLFGQSDDETFEGFQNPVANLDDFEDEDTSSGSDFEIDSESDVSSEGEIPSSDDGSTDNDIDNPDDNMSPQQLKDYKPRWKRIENNAKHFTVMPFNKPHGANFPPNFDAGTAKAVDYFMLFMSEDIIDDIVRHTNNYAVWLQQHNNKNDPHWKPVTPDDIKAFIAISIIFGISRMSCYKQYWSCDKYIGNQGVKDIMVKKRYEQINRYLHLSDRGTEPQRGTPGYDKLFKTRQFLDDITANFRRWNNPSPEQTIDEAMVKFKGRLSYVQYMPLKPTKRGLKLWVRCDAKTGYCNEMEVYLGKSQEAASVNGSYFDVCKRLTDKILHLNHIIYFDNAYSSVPLALHLLQNETYCCGTLRVSRKNVPECIKVNERQLARGEFVVAQDESIPELCATVWRDTKCVRFLSTNSTPTLSTVTSRRINGVRQNVPQPIAGHAYSRFMKGVDVYDSLRSNVSIGRTSKKSWKYLFYLGVTSAMVNSWLLYREHSPLRAKTSHTKFRHEVAMGLLESYLEQRQPGVAHKHVKLRERGRLCKPHKIYRPNGKDKCDTKYGCSACGIHICSLCFGRYHANM